MESEKSQQCALLLLIIASAFLQPSNAFSLCSKYRHCTICTPSGRTSTQLHLAYIFGEDDGSMTELESSSLSSPRIGIDDDFSSFSPMLFPPSIFQDLSRIESDKALLARLSAANPPTGTSIQLSHLEDVTVLHVQESSITLSAVVRNGDQCVTIAVPIGFPEPCVCGDDDGVAISEQLQEQQQDDELLQNCILHNLQLLDQKAKDILQQQADLDANYEAIEAYKRQAAQLRSVDGVEFPSWWIPPADTNGVEAESKSLRSLLNEDDFQPDVVSLARHGIRWQLQEDEDYYLVVQAGIRSISPAGLMLGALIRDPQDQDKEDVEEVAAESKNLPRDTIAVDVPIPFPTKAADASEMRENVLDMVETLE